MILKDDAQSDDVILFKKNIRRYIRDIRSSISSEDLFFRSYSIYKTLIGIVDLSKIRVISCYIDFDNEVATYIFILHCLERGVEVVVPKICSGEMLFKHITKEFTKNKYGILEPTDDAKDCDISDIDIFIIPALAFDESGGRLGYGKGFYDRALKDNKSALRIGLSYSFQVLPFIPSSEHDEFVDIVVTEHSIVLPSDSFISHL